MLQKLVSQNHKCYRGCMSSHETRVWETPDEERLASLMETASTLLRPGTGYEMEMNLVGIKPNDSTFEHLQRRFQYLLDREKGSNLKIAMHSDSNELILNHFSSQIIDDAGQVDLQRIAIGDQMPLRYLPTVELRGKRYDASESTWDQRWQEDIDLRILDGHDIPPKLQNMESAAKYRMWLGHNILSQCSNWYLLERVVLNQTILGSEVVRISIAHRQNMSENTNVSYDSLSFLHEKEDLESKGKTIKQRLDLVSHQGNPRFMLTAPSSLQAKYRRAVFRHAEADNITEFTNLVEPVLSTEKS